MADTGTPGRRVLVTGSNGQLGHEILRDAGRYGIETIGMDLQALDITRADAVDRALEQYPVDAVINAAAFTAVDRAEQESAQAYAINRDAVAGLAQACAQRDIPLIHLSTDYVFDGNTPRPYTETDTPAPLGVYGASKLAGEQQLKQRLPKHIILRTSWVFGSHGQNFVKTMLRLAQQHRRLSIVNDQYGCPTPARALAQATLSLLRPICRAGFDDWGTYHYCGTPETNWFDFAQAIFSRAAALGLIPRPIELTPIPTSAYPTPARRPRRSSLDTTRIGQIFGLTAADWQAGLDEVLTELSLRPEHS